MHQDLWKKTKDETTLRQVRDPTSPHAILDNLVRFVQVIGRDPKLLEWFRSLENKSPAQRSIEILAMEERIAREQKDPDLAASFKLLAEPTVFDALRAALGAL